MELSSRSKAFLMPEYNLTGDLLSFLTCNLQYRYQNKGTLPPSKPVQLWFGEFIHGIMEEAYLEYANNHKKFPWEWKKDIRPLEEMIDKRLQVRGLYPPENFYCHFNHPNNNTAQCPTTQHPHKLLYSYRAERAINTLGPDLFPLIDNAEVLLKGMRNMPNYKKGYSRSNYYSINGVIDVLSSIKIEETIKQENTNKIIQYLLNDESFKQHIKTYQSDEYEIIIDYKGMKRPATNDKNWKRHNWQIQTYAWLRKMQEDSKPVVAGIIFYLNELAPSEKDLKRMKEDLSNNSTDIRGHERDENLILDWETGKKFPKLSNKFMMDRCVRIVNIQDQSIDNALNEFDKVVEKIEKSTISELTGVGIKEAWKAEADKITCDACDFKTFCDKHKLDEMTIP
jgi:CRISPR/Cas system-associated exonuclease Cas4 (RecB family)